MKDAHNQNKAPTKDAPQPMIVATFDMRALPHALPLNIWDWRGRSDTRVKGR